MSKKHMVIALNKTDIDSAKDNIKKFKSKVKGVKIYPISNMTKDGINKLLVDVYKLVNKPIEDEEIESVPVKKYIYEPEFVVNIDEDGVFVVTGKKVEILAEMTKFNEDEALRRFQNILKKMGVETALEQKGCKVGDTVRIGVFEFVFQK